MNLLRLIFTLLVFMPLSGCALTGGPVEGRVLEEGTNKPIAGAIVVVRWKGDLPSFADSKTVCYHVASTVSDEAGRYFIEPWRKETTADWQTRIINKEAVAVAYKAGYAFPNQTFIKGDINYLAPFNGTSGERLGYLRRIFGGTSCGTQDDSAKNILPLLRALYDEAMLHGGDKKRAQNEMSLMESIRYEIEILEFGYKEAEKRHLNRP